MDAGGGCFRRAQSAAVSASSSHPSGRPRRVRSRSHFVAPCSNSLDRRRGPLDARRPAHGAHAQRRAVELVEGRREIRRRDEAARHLAHEQFLRRRGFRPRAVGRHGDLEVLVDARALRVALLDGVQERLRVGELGRRRRRLGVEADERGEDAHRCVSLRSRARARRRLQCTSALPLYAVGAASALEDGSFTAGSASHKI